METVSVVSLKGPVRLLSLAAPAQGVLQSCNMKTLTIDFVSIPTGTQAGPSEGNSVLPNTKLQGL